MKKRTEYPINSDFDKWKDFNPPLDNKVVLWFMQKLMGILYLKEKSDETCDVIKYKIPYGKKRNMKALLYAPKLIPENAPCLIYFHGGGFVLPAAPYHYNNARKYAVSTPCKILFVDYPISPQSKFPIAVNACFTAYKWARKNAKQLKIDKNKIAIGGDSAGGNLASVVCMMAHDYKIQRPIAQMLIYPAISSGIETHSMKHFTDTPLCNSEDVEKYANFYFKKEKDKYKKYVSPMNAKNYSIFPPTYIETAEFDCLRDEAILFAEALKNANIQTILNNTKETMHGYDMVEDSDITIQNMQKRIDFLKKHLN